MINFQQYWSTFMIEHYIEAKNLEAQRILKVVGLTTFVYVT